VCPVRRTLLRIHGRGRAYVLPKRLTKRRNVDPFVPPSEATEVVTNGVAERVGSLRRAIPTPTVRDSHENGRDFCLDRLAAHFAGRAGS
jgi:hypothetical protein